MRNRWAIAAVVMLGATAWASDEHPVAQLRRAVPSLLQMDPPLKFTFTVEELFVPTQTEMQLIREQASIFPDHPDRHWIELERRRLEGKDVELCTTYFGNGSMRANRDSDSVNGEYMDLVVDGRTSWVLSPETLRIVDRETPPNEPGFEYWTMLPQRLNEVVQFFSCGLSDIPLDDVELSEARWSGDRWSWESDHPRDAQLVLRAGGARVGEAVTVDRFEIAARDTRVIVAEWAAADWRLEPSLGRAVAHEVVVSYPEAKIRRRFRLSAVENIERAFFAAALAPPEPTGSDVIRASLAITGFEDLRPGQGTVGRRTGDGFAVAPSPMIAERPWRSRLRITGWVFAAGLLGLITLWYWRKGRIQKGA